MNKSVPNYVTTLKSTPESISEEKSIILGHPRSVTSYNLGWPWVTLDDLETWRVMYSKLVGAYFGSGIHLALNTDPETRFGMTENKQQKRPLAHAWPCETLTSGWLYRAPRYPQTSNSLRAMKKHTPESKKTHSAAIDRKIRRFRPNMASCTTS